jgi:hypothetical protein
VKTHRAAEMPENARQFRGRTFDSDRSESIESQGIALSQNPLRVFTQCRPEAAVCAAHALPALRGAVQSKNFQVLAPSNLRIRVVSMTDGSKLRKFIPIRFPPRAMGSQCVTQPHSAHLHNARHLSPHT